MPIKPENRHRYPPEWPEVRRRILERARHCCEWPGCGVPNYAVGEWQHRPRNPPASGWRFVPLGGNATCDAAGRGELSFSEARECAAANNEGRDDGGRYIVIVLTVAHLDHKPENCGPSNLRAWCQRHHLAYDQEHHAETAWRTRKALDPTPDLFGL